MIRWETADSSKTRKVGRPRKVADIRKLVLQLAHANPGWGYTRIRDALRGVKIEIGRTTVANLLTAAGTEPAPERNRKRTWKLFLKSHLETLFACDLTERHHQGIDSRRVTPAVTRSNDNVTHGAIGCRSRLGGLLNYYRQAA